MISALILAAGQSRRMGRSKMPLPWGANTVLGQVIEVLRVSLVDDVLVVTGGDRATIEQIAEAWRARTVYNPHYATEEMLSSLQVGLEAMPVRTGAALIVLGDQPQIQRETVLAILHEYDETHAPLIVPSYRMHRGHPWLIARELWPELLAMRPPETPRDFLDRHAQGITYVDMNTPYLLQDIDTPQDYEQARPGHENPD
jgi:molybdenum cofactor cytidylyltransferase